MSDTAYYEPLALDVDALFSVEHVSYSAGETHPCFMHFHECTEIILFERVAGELQTPDRTSKLSSGSLVVSGPFAPHHYQLSDHAKSWYILKLASSSAHTHLQASRQSALQTLAQLHHTVHRKLELQAFNRVLPLFQWLSEDQAGNCTIAICELIARYCMEQIELEPESTSSHLRQKLDPLVQAIRQGKLHLNQSEAARLCYVSDSYFCRLFKNVFGTTYKSYLNEHRLRTSLTLLANDASTEAIALDLGYSSSSHFIARFKERFDCTPYQWKRKQSTA